MKWSREDYVQYRMSEYIKEKATKSTVILHFDIIDSGVYFLTGIEPPCRVFHSFNMFSPEELGYYEEYICNNSAEFIVTAKEQYKLELYGYEKVIDEAQQYIDDLTRHRFILYARSDLIDGKENN